MVHYTGSRVCHEYDTPGYRKLIANVKIGSKTRSKTCQATKMPIRPNCAFDHMKEVGLEPLRGTATTFHEMLSPRLDDHHVVITSRGLLHDGRSFRFNLNHLADETQSILIRIE
jgi:hypothetical protein